MKKTLLFILLGAAAGVAGYQLYKKHAEQAEDIYAQEASEHQYGAYISKPVRAENAEPKAAEEPETAADTGAAEASEETPVLHPEVTPRPADEGPAESVGKTIEAEAGTETVADASAGEEKLKKTRKAESKKN